MAPGGSHAWDGDRWCPVSPDGRFAWDGQQWVRLEGFSPTPPVVVARGGPLEFDYPVPSRSGARGTQFAVIDLETTGFSPSRDRVVEVAVVRVDGSGRVLNRWQSLVNPGRPTGPAWVHRITDAMVASAPSFDDLADDLVAQLSGAVVVAHNASFEEGFLRAEFARCGARLPAWPALCTMRWSRALVAAPNHRLSTLTELLGIELADPHTALGDADATTELLTRLLEAAPREPRWSTPAPVVPCLPQGRGMPRQPRDPHPRRAAPGS